MIEIGASADAPGQKQINLAIYKATPPSQIKAEREQEREITQKVERDISVISNTLDKEYRAKKRKENEESARLEGIRKQESRSSLQKPRSGQVSYGTSRKTGTNSYSSANRQ